MSRLTFFCDLAEATIPLPHFWEHTVGSDHARMALRADWQRQLKQAHEELGFRHVRFHGLLSDDMRTVIREHDRFLYSFFNSDQIFDFLLSIFIHHLSHTWIDFRGIQDEYMRGKAINYFENIRRAIYAQQDYAMRNPKKFAGYSRFSWGITATDGPGPAVRRVNGRKIRFHHYRARSIHYGPDDGTLAPWAVVASFPFAPEVVLPSLSRLNKDYPEITNKYGFKCSYNPTFTPAKGKGWVSKGYYGLDQGPIVMMIEN